MQAKSFFASLFDFSFSSFITGRIIKVLYVLTTIVVALITLGIVLLGFRASSGGGIFTLLVVAPLFFVFTMIYARVGLELLLVLFRIHENVHAMNARGAGTDLPATTETAAPVAASVPEPA